jgi:hypothetical protein
MKLQDLKAQTPAELVSCGRKVEMQHHAQAGLMFAILKQLASETDIIGEGVVEFSPTDSVLALAGRQLSAGTG